MKTIQIVTPDEFNPDDFELIDGKWQIKHPNSRVRMFGENGFLSDDITIWTGITYSTNGSWSVDYSSANFASPPFVVVTAHSNGDATADGNYASINYNTITATGCSGKANNAVAAGLLVAVSNTAASTTISVVAIGIPK